MDRIKPLPARTMNKALEKLGFQQIRQKGCHLFMQHPDGRSGIIPMYPGEDVGKGMIRKVINDARITKEAWLELIEVV